MEKGLKRLVQSQSGMSDKNYTKTQNFVQKAFLLASSKFFVVLSFTLKVDFYTESGTNVENKNFFTHKKC